MPLPLDLGDVEVTVLMPCLNEAKTVGICVQKARRALDDLGVTGEVVVADNGSVDGSREIAAAAGAPIVPVAQPGYGSALMGGIASARGRFIVMADADDTYDLGAIGPFIERLRDGSDLVLGNRFIGGVEPGAMPALHRYVGNPVLSFLPACSPGVRRATSTVACADFARTRSGASICGQPGWSSRTLSSTPRPWSLSVSRRCCSRSSPRSSRSVKGCCRRTPSSTVSFAMSRETGLVVGGLLLLIGLAGSLVALGIWSATSFGELDPSNTLRLVVVSATTLALGAEVIVASFFFSILGLRRR